MHALATESNFHSNRVAVTSLLLGGAAAAVGASVSPAPAVRPSAARAVQAATARFLRVGAGVGKGALLGGSPVRGRRSRTGGGRVGGRDGGGRCRPYDVGGRYCKSLQEC